MKKIKEIVILIVLLAAWICLPSPLKGQAFYLSVNSYLNSCTKERTYPSWESQINWSLNSNKAVMYYGTNNSPINVFQVLKFEYDQSKDYFVYSIYDSARNRYGVMVYFRPNNYMSLQYENQSCTVDFFLR
jgi:hypothetical protein